LKRCSFALSAWHRPTRVFGPVVFCAAPVHAGSSVADVGMRKRKSASRKHAAFFRRSVFLCTAAAIAIVVSVISDAVLTLVRLPKVDLSL